MEFEDDFFRDAGSDSRVQAGSEFAGVSIDFLMAADRELADCITAHRVC